MSEGGERDIGDAAPQYNAPAPVVPQYAPIDQAPVSAPPVQQAVPPNGEPAPSAAYPIPDQSAQAEQDKIMQQQQQMGGGGGGGQQPLQPQQPMPMQVQMQQQPMQMQPMQPVQQAQQPMQQPMQGLPPQAGYGGGYAAPMALPVVNNGGYGGQYYGGGGQPQYTGQPQYAGQPQQPQYGGYGQQQPQYAPSYGQPQYGGGGGVQMMPVAGGYYNPNQPPPQQMQQQQQPMQLPAPGAGAMAGAPMQAMQPVPGQSMGAVNIVYQSGSAPVVHCLEAQKIMQEGLFDCCVEPGTFAFACFCWCCAWGRIMEQSQLSSCCGSCCEFAMRPPCQRPCYSQHMVRKMYSQFGLADPGCCGPCCAHTWCTPCALARELRASHAYWLFKNGDQPANGGAGHVTAHGGSPVTATAAFAGSKQSAAAQQQGVVQAGVYQQPPMAGGQPMAGGGGGVAAPPPQQQYYGGGQPMQQQQQPMPVEGGKPEMPGISRT